ncbi:hypothetical protein [Neobacillus drentensis]|uniref:hypothetical protein n=1 Tax=Neobacillus drentensis TaxID=220684 RepID=UPI002FFED64D
MEVYRLGEKWVMGLKGGHFNNLQKGSEAIIVDRHPTPIKMWKSKTLVDKQEDKGEVWEYDYTFRQHQGNDNDIFFFEIKFTRQVPGYSYGTIEYFVNEEYVKEKIDYLHQQKMLAEYLWDSERGTFIENFRDFKYEDEETEEYLPEE